MGLRSSGGKEKRQCQTKEDGKVQCIKKDEETGDHIEVEIQTGPDGQAQVTKTDAEGYDEEEEDEFVDWAMKRASTQPTTGNDGIHSSRGR